MYLVNGVTSKYAYATYYVKVRLVRSFTNLPVNLSTRQLVNFSTRQLFNFSTCKDGSPILYTFVSRSSKPRL